MELSQWPLNLHLNGIEADETRAVANVQKLKKVRGVEDINPRSMWRIDSVEAPTADDALLIVAGELYNLDSEWDEDLALSKWPAQEAP